MKTITCFGRNLNQYRLKTSIILFVWTMFLLFSSCQKYENDIRSSESMKNPDMIILQGFSSDCSSRRMTIYYGHEIFKRSFGSPVVETRVLSNPSFSCFDGKFILNIRNGKDKRTRVSSGEVWIDGKLIVRQSDFSKNALLIIKPLTGLTPESKIEVKLTGTPGSFIDLWIEGTMKKVIPVFDQIGPLCQNSTPPLLPLSSLNNPAITGIWDPEIIVTTEAGKTCYTFTPEEGQCASTVRMEIEVIPTVTPQFGIDDTLIQDSEAPVLPSTSINGIKGTWDPEVISTATAGNFTYTFTPDPDQCASVYTINVEIVNNGTITDVEGNIYKIVKIGDQWWMAENLKTTTYNNDDLIGTTNPATLDITSEPEPKYQWAYNGNETNVSIYGRLYTWFTVNDSRGVCPTGWHIPSDTEWTKLTDYLIDNGYGHEGSGTDIAKSLASITGWSESKTAGNIGNDQESNNLSGFTAVPAGYRVMDGKFTLLGTYASWWSSTENIGSKIWFRFLKYNLNYVTRTASDKRQGGAVRCIKDN